MARARRLRSRGKARGFTLVEVLLTLALMAISVLPALEWIKRAESYAYDAKFSTLCAAKIRGLISEITRTQKPGATGAGDLSTLGDDEGFDRRDAFANIRYEWQVLSADLSLDITPTTDMSDEAKQKEQDKKTNQDKASKDEAADAAIDERFRARYVKVTFTYHLESGDERQIIVETYVPPIPLDKSQDGRNDLVAPNNGSNG